MAVYWSFFILGILLLVTSQNRTVSYVSNGITSYHTPKALVWCSVFFIAFFVSLRDVVLDTYAYIVAFDDMPLDYEQMVTTATSGTGKGFQLLSGLFKIFISTNHYVWLGFVGCVSLYFLFRFYKCQSCNFALTFFLFIASTNFSWLLNGARQFLAACIMIGLSTWYVYGHKKQKMMYILLMVLMIYIHSSAIFVIPLTILSARSKVLGKWMFVIALATFLAMTYMGDVLAAASDIMEKKYDFSESKGSSVPRLLVASVPLVLVLFRLKRIKKEATPMMAFAINMSFCGVCFYYAATFSSGILIGRMPIYFTLYNLVLIPWLLKKYYANSIFLWGCVVFYSLFFYFQMCIAWHHLEYTSYILDLSLDAKR